MATTQRNKRWLRKILYGLLILTGIVTVVLFYLIATFDIEAHRAKIKSIISHSLDREVRIDGKIELEPSLWPRFVGEDISIGNPSWATVSDLVRVKRFEIQVALLPLLWKELKILELNLIGVHVHLERDEKNTPNWLMKRLDSGKLIAKVLPAVLAMHIKGSTFTLHVKDRPSITLSIDKLENSLAMDEPFKLEGNLIYKDIPIGLSLRGGPLYQMLSQDSRWPFQGKILIDAIPVRLEGFITDPVRLQEIQLKIATGHSRDDRLKSRFDGRLHEVGDMSVNLEITAVEAGHRVMIMSKASKLDLTGLMSVKRFMPVSGVKLSSFASTFESEGRTVNDIIMNSRLSLIAKQGEVHWHPLNVKQSKILHIESIEMQAEPRQAIRLSLKTQHNDVAMELRGHLGRLGELINKEKPFPLNFRLKAADMTAEFTGFLQKPLQDFAVVGGLEIQAAQLTTLIRLLGPDWERNQPLSVSGQLDYKPGKMYLREAKLATEGVSMTGEVAYVSDDSPRCDIHLQTIVIDLSKYIKPVDKTKNGISASTLPRKAQRVIPDVLLNTSLLKSLSTAIQIDDLKVMHGAKHITTIKAKLSIVNGVLSLLPFEGRSPTGSSSQASLVLDTSVEPPQAALFIKTEDLDYGLILNNMDITKDVVGTLNLKLDLKGQGLSLRELLGNANGDLEIVTDKGRIPKRLLELWGGGLVRVLIPTTWFEKDVTDLNCAVCRFEINDGIMQSNLLLADTERITVAGKTVLDLKTEQVSGLFNPRNKEAVLFRLGTPMKVTGTLAEIKAEPAPSGLVTLGKLILGLSRPGSLILLFGDLGTTEKNPCEALLHHPLSNNQSGVQQ